MGALIGTGAGVAYVIIGMFTARHLYRRWRAKIAQIRLCKKCTNWDRMCADCKRELPWWSAVVDFVCLDYSPLGRSGTPIFFAYMHGLLWPLAGPVYGSFRFITNNPPLSSRELEKQVRERDKRIAQMQEELDRALAE